MIMHAGSFGLLPACDVDVPMINLNGQEMTLPEFMKEFFDWEQGMICILVVFAYCLVSRTAAICTLSRVSYLRR